MGILVAMPVIGLVGLGLVGIASAVAQSPSGARRRHFCVKALIACWRFGSSSWRRVGLWTVRQGILADNYYAIMAGLVAVTILPLSRVVTGTRLRAGWKGLGLLWAFWGGLVLLVESYACNRPVDFYASVFINVFLLILCPAQFPDAAYVAILAVNTLILLLIGVPALDLALRAIPHPARRKLDPREELYSYRNAEKDPASFARWCDAFDAEFHKMVAEIFVPDPTGQFLPRPQTQQPDEILRQHHLHQQPGISRQGVFPGKRRRLSHCGAGRVNHLWRHHAGGGLALAGSA